MYVILAKVEVVYKIYGPYTTRDKAAAVRKELNKKSRARHVVRSLSEVHTTEEMEV